ncbi:MAG: DUF1854 domain-containing protein [Burkholderiaceae bacterium]|nr:DUF1854 domain-containing protein [Burkholderiaceae bacterium]
MSTEAASFSLSRDAFGRLVLRDADGTTHSGVVPARAFPISAPGEGVSLLGSDGRERVWIERLSSLEDTRRVLIEEELAAREFVPQIREIRAVSSFFTPSTWHVATDRGETQFVLRGEEAIRRLSRKVLLIADDNGVHYLVRDVEALDPASRKLLDRFM